MKIFDITGFFTIGFQVQRPILAENEAQAVESANTIYGNSGTQLGKPHYYKAFEAHDYMQDVNLHQNIFTIQDGKVINPRTNEIFN